MKIATFNINNVKRRLPNLLQWLRATKPDIVCLQELKCTDAEFPAQAIERAGYGADGAVRRASIWKRQILPIRPPHHIHELLNLAPLVGLISRRDRVFDAMRDMIAKDFLLDPS